MPTIRSSTVMLVSLIMLSCLCSCATIFTTYSVTLPKDVDLTANEVTEKIPLVAGLYLSSAFRNCTVVEQSPLAVQPTTHHIGDAFSSNCERMVRNMFQSLTLVDGTTVAPSAKDVDVVISPVLLRTGFQQKVPEGGTVAVLLHEMTVKWDVASPDGKAVYTTTVLSHIPVPVGLGGASLMKAGVERIREKEMRELLQAQFRKAQDDIYTNTWWKNPWWKSRD